MDDGFKKYPVPTIRRLPLYLRVIREMAEKGQTSVSATDIANELNFDSIKVRKDLAYTRVTGKPRVGYQITELVNGIRAIIGWDRNSPAILVGAGNLGSALMGFPGFAKRGLNFVAAFDNNASKVGQRIHEREVYPMDKLESYIRANHIEVAVLTIPAFVAQDVADRLANAGIRGIWNFSQLKLKVPPGVVVQNENLVSGLAVFMVRLASGCSEE